MKILKLQFFNLNSLAGEQTLNFVEGALNGCGIFAITGPTGAGKTTILDALCLALYGMTPRLSQGQELSEVMTRHTGECWSEVTFQVPTGNYRARWSLRRARNQSQGKPQPAKMEVVKLDAEKSIQLTTKLKESQELVAELTGLNFQRFTRSILLAQGSFAAFLQAKAEERAELLEQMTGTAIYGEVSRLAFESHREREQAVKLKESRLSGIELMPDESLSALKTEIVDLQKTRDQQQQSVSLLTEQSKIPQALADHQARRQKWQTAFDLLQHKKFEAKAWLEQLPLARQAAELTPLYEAKEQATVRWTELDTQLTTEVKAEKNAALNVHKLQDEEASVVAKLKEFQAELAKAEPIWKEVRHLDHDLQVKTAALKQVGQELQSLSEKSETVIDEKSRLDHQLMLLARDVAQLDARLQATACDEALAERLPEATKQLQELSFQNEKWQTIEKNTKEIDQVVKQLQAEQQTIEAQERALESQIGQFQETLAKSTDLLKNQPEGGDLTRLEQNRQKTQHRLNQAADLSQQAANLRQLHQQLQQLTAQIEKNLAEKGVIQADFDLFSKDLTKQGELVALLKEKVDLERRIASLDDHRQSLVDGEPCPLCGALEHPYATPGQLPENHSEQRLKEAEAVLSDLSQKVQNQQNQLTAVQTRVDTLTDQQTKLQTTLTEAEAKCVALVEVLAAPVDFADLEALQLWQGQLQATAEQAQQQIELCRQLHQQLQQESQTLHEAQLKRTHLAERVERVTADLAERQKQLQTLAQQKETITKLLAELTNWFTDFAEQQQVTLALDADWPISSQITEIDQFVQKLTEQSKKWQATKEAWKTTQTQRDNKQLSLQHLTELLGELKVQQTKKMSEKDVILGDFNRFSQRRHELLGDRAVDDVERELRGHVAEQTTLLQTKQAAFLQAKDELTALRAKIASNTTHVATAKNQAETQTRHWQEALANSPFSDEKAYFAANWSKSVFNERLTLFEQFDRESTELQAQDQAWREIEGELKAKVAELPAASELKQQLEAANTTLSQTTESFGRLQERVAQQEALRRQQGALLAEIETAKAANRPWALLNELIGSANGQKFRRYAQGLTLDYLLRLANRQLQKLNGRYLLRRLAGEDLELEVIDRFQADTVRSIKNLSGGEQFLVSLALALGLSGLTGSRVKMESLFLDEGFGTLDQESLDIALSALSSLQEEGRMIGIISHVESLKERIPVQIQVIPTGGGRSRLQLSDQL